MSSWAVDSVGILYQAVAELLDPLQAVPILRTSVMYLIAFCSQLEAASDVISG